MPVLHPIANCFTTFQLVRCGDVELVLVPSQFNSFGSLIFVAFIDFFLAFVGDPFAHVVFLVREVYL